MLTITSETARRFILGKQGLWPTFTCRMFTAYVTGKAPLPDDGLQYVRRLCG